MKKGRVFLIAFLISFVVVSIVIAVEMSFRKKAMAEEFQQKNANYCLEWMNTGYAQYYQNEDYIKELESLKGGSLSEEERKEQFVYYLTNTSEHNNASTFTMVTSKNPLIGGGNLYYDSDMNLLNTEDVLFLVKEKNVNEKIIQYYYIFRDYDLSQKINKLSNENARAKFRINVADVYIKDDQFIPKTITADVFSTDGTGHHEEELYSHIVPKDEMISDGFSFEKLNCTFHIGDNSSSEKNSVINSDDGTTSFVVYADGPDKFIKQRNEELIKQNRQKLESAQDGNIFKTFKNGSNTEYFAMDTVESEDGKTKYYVVAYETCHFLVDSFLYYFVSKHPLFDFLLFPIEILLAIVLAIVGAIVYIKIRSKHI
ncbi:MAG: hypothetical protein K6F55_11200 [Eubacterium sp.]|nr:hypothetical protein [Eubacterium sp.]